MSDRWSDKPLDWIKPRNLGAGPRCPFCKSAKGEIRKVKQDFRDFVLNVVRRGRSERARMRR